MEKVRTYSKRDRTFAGYLVLNLCVFIGINSSQTLQPALRDVRKNNEPNYTPQAYQDSRGEDYYYDDYGEDYADCK